MSLWIQVRRCDLPVIWKLVRFSCWLCLRRLWWWSCQSINGGSGETCFPFRFTLQCIAIHWSAKQSTRRFLLYFYSSVSLSSAFETVADVSWKKMLEQWQLYRRLLCDVLGTSMISPHLHCSWLLHFVKSLHLLCTNSGMFFYQGIHMCVSVCVLYLLVQYLRLKWYELKERTAAFTSKTGYIPYIQSCLFSAHISKVSDWVRIFFL